MNIISAKEMSDGMCACGERERERENVLNTADYEICSNTHSSNMPSVHHTSLYTLKVFGPKILYITIITRKMVCCMRGGLRGAKLCSLIDKLWHRPGKII